MKPIWKILIVVGLVVGVLILLVAVPHYRARAAVTAYRKKLKARGEKITIAELIPPLSAEQVTDGRELIAALGRIGNLTNSPPCMRWVAPGHALVGWAESNLPTYYASNCWPEVSEAVKTHREPIVAIRVALQKPTLAFSVDYQEGFSTSLPHLSLLKKSSLWLSSATLVALHDGETTNAWGNLQAEADLARLNRGEPLLISQLVRFAITQIAISITWEAWQYPAWSEQQLGQLQTNWESIDLLDHLESSLSMERVMGRSVFIEMRSSYSNYANVISPAFSSSAGPRYDTFGQVLGNPTEGLKTHLHYRAWKSWSSYEEEVFIMQIWQTALETARVFRTRDAFIPELKNFHQAITNLQNLHPGWEKRFAFANDGVFGGGDLAKTASNFLVKAADVETERRMLVTAIALKRYRLRHGKYPASLTDLTPDYLPKVPIDFMDGKPLRYHRKDDDTFLFYSVGEDGKDDGGDGTLPPGLNYKAWYKGRDIVWPMPATLEEVKNYETEILSKLKQEQGPGKLLPLPFDLTPAGTNGGTN